MHGGGNAQIEGQNLAVQSAQLLFVGGHSFLDGVIVGAFLAGEGRDAARAQVSGLRAQAIHLLLYTLVFTPDLFEQFNFRGRVTVLLEQTIGGSFVACQRITFEIERLARACQIVKFASCHGLLNLLFDVVMILPAAHPVRSSCLFVLFGVFSGVAPIFEIHTSPACMLVYVISPLFSTNIIVCWMACRATS